MGHTLFTNNCATGGCHDVGNDAFFNAAGSISILNHAIDVGFMTAHTANDAAVVAHIASILPAQNPSGQVVAFNFGPGLGAGTLFTLPNIFHSTYWAGGSTSAVSATGTAPSKGSVTYSSLGLAYRALYRATACQTGADTFQYFASGAGGSTSTRTATVSISNPSSAPTINSGAPPGGETGTPYSHTATVALCPGLVMWSLTGAVPPGLGIGALTGTISGTPSAVGTFNGNIVATYSGGMSSSQPYSINVGLGVPSITSGATAGAAAVGVGYSGYTIMATNSPTTFAGSGLPPGLSVVPGTGAVTGIPSDASGSPYSASLTASNGTGAGAPKIVTFNVVPSINSPATASGATGSAFSYQISGNPGPAYISYAALDPLPAGLTLGAGTGVISGTPTVVGGPTNVRLTASTGFGTSAQFTLGITITLGLPVITNAPLTATGGEAVVFTPFQITATNAPHTAFHATGLPPGLTMSASGLITGTPNSGTAGLWPVTISADNATGAGAGVTLNITISQFAPVNTSLVAPAGQTGVPYSFQITASNGPTFFNAANLPPGLTVNTGSGLISGIPTAVGAFNAATITSGNGSGSDTDVVPFNITLGPPVISSPATAGGAVGFAFSYQIVASNSPTLYAVSNLPPGVTLNAGSGLLSGTPTVNGTYAGTMTATNTTTFTTVPLTITIAVGIPAITSAAASAATGDPFSYQVIATNGPASYAASGLPAGLTINTSNGRIGGAPTVSGTFVVNLSATNGSGTGTGVLTLTVSLSPPTTGNSIVTVNAVPGRSFSYAVSAQNPPFTFSATGLPASLVLDAATGVISGTLNVPAGTYDALITVTNSSGTTSFTLRIVVGYVVPRAADAAFDVPFETATPLPLPATGQVVTVNILTLPGHGLVTTQANSATVTYTPAKGYSGADAFTYSITNPAGTSGVASVSIDVGSLIPLAQAGTVTVQLNTPATIDMAKFVKGSQLTGVSIATVAAHGTATVNGLAITYTPRTNYFGSDAFAYVAYGDAGTSSPATISVEVVGRPDPAADREVLGLVDAQSQAARRFSAAQVGNYQRRMEALHRSDLPGPSAAVAAQRTATPAGADPAPRAMFDSQQPGASGFMPVSLITTLMNVATTRSLDVSASSNGGVVSSQAFVPTTSLWIGGAANFGSRDATGERDRLRFSTDGVSAGVDRSFSERLSAGVGVGYGRDDSDVGSNSRLKASGASAALYGSYQPSPRTFIDMLVGYGQLRFDTRRYVEPLEEFADGRRKGSQVFGSVSAGYEARKDNLLVSPYGRVDFSVDRLDAVTESGVGNYALRFNEATQRSVQLAAGLRAESKHETEFGFAVPRARAEYRRELQSQRAATLAYADLLGGPEYTVTPAGISRNSFLLGVGVDLVFGGGLRVGLDYTAQRASGASNVQGIRLMVTQELDGRPGRPWRWEPTTFSAPVNVDAGFSWDDNVTRGREAGDRLTDRSFSLGFSQTRPFRINANTRFVATALANAEKFDRYAGLGRFAAGGQGELQYRSSGAFDAITFGFVGRAMYEQYESSLRSGPRYFAGVNMRRAITDRIEAFAEVGASARNGRSDVFAWRDWSAKVNLDWSIGKGLVYMTGEYRRGDTVSSGHPSLVNIGLTEVFTADDAFDGQDLVSYRFDARTVMGTLGYNHPLGARDSIDFSWRRIEATPTRKPAFDFSGPLRYIDNQYAIVYLMRF